jgi:hypothetical protein
MSGNKNSNHIQKFNHKISTYLGIPYSSTAKNMKETTNGNSNSMKSYIFTHTRQDVKLH